MNKTPRVNAAYTQDWHYQIDRILFESRDRQKLLLNAMILIPQLHTADARMMTTIVPCDNPAKMWAGYLVSDYLEYTVFRTSQAFVGWIPFNRSLVVNPLNGAGVPASYMLEGRQLNRGPGMMHLGALDGTALNWNKTIRHIELIKQLRKEFYTQIVEDTEAVACKQTKYLSTVIYEMLRGYNVI